MDGIYRLGNASEQAYMISLFLWTKIVRHATSWVIRTLGPLCGTDSKFESIEASPGGDSPVSIRRWPVKRRSARWLVLDWVHRRAASSWRLVQRSNWLWMQCARVRPTASSTCSVSGRVWTASGRRVLQIRHDARSSCRLRTPTRAAYGSELIGWKITSLSKENCPQRNNPSIGVDIWIAPIAKQLRLPSLSWEYVAANNAKSIKVIRIYNEQFAGESNGMKKIAVPNSRPRGLEIYFSG